MKKIKELGFIIKNESKQIVIRSINNSDLSYYKNWSKNGHIKKEAVDTISELEIDNWIFQEIKMNYIFIIELNNKPCGELVLWNDTSLNILDKNYNKPIYSIMIKFYEDINNREPLKTQETIA